MTREELINDGWKPQLCKVGTLFFKDGYFCRFTDDGVLLYSTSNDRVPLGTVYTIKGIAELEKSEELNVIKSVSTNLGILKMRFKKKYGEDPEI